jgi:hypothetical protein
MSDQPLQLSVTRIAADVYRVVVQSDRKTLYTANVEVKHIRETIEAELPRLAVLPFNGCGGQ